MCGFTLRFPCSALHCINKRVLKPPTIIVLGPDCIVLGLYPLAVWFSRQWEIRHRKLCESAFHGSINCPLCCPAPGFCPFLQIRKTYSASGAIFGPQQKWEEFLQEGQMRICSLRGPSRWAQSLRRLPWRERPFLYLSCPTWTRP